MRTPPTRYDTYECTRVHAYTQRVCWYVAYDATMVFIVIRVCVCGSIGWCVPRLRERDRTDARAVVATRVFSASLVPEMD